MIRSPYNFIPLEKEVFIPDWIDQISHDIPFSDGVSGKITLEMEAQTPVFVRNGQVGDTVDNSFSRTNDNRYFIPGTSIKGTIRNVLEIISHGKMRTNKNQLFAQREWGNSQLYNLKSKQTNFKCGWLKWDKENGYYIVDCGKPYRIGHDRIDEFLKQELFESYFSKKKGIDLNKKIKLAGIEYDPKTAHFKYILVNQLGITLDNKSFEIDPDHNSSGSGFTRVKVSESQTGFMGTIVFTGQPDKWESPRPKKLTKGAGKFYDFVFKNPSDDARKERITDDEFESYQTIYKDSPDWKYWYDRIDGTGIPVFFMKEKGQKMKWGLALLFKLPYDNTPFETMYEAHKTEAYDLADCIFGVVDKNRALKGRVSFGHAFCITDDVSPIDEVRLVLSSPKASYYPMYISQSGKDSKTSQYKTYNDGVISGWKRYVAREGVYTPTMPPVTSNGQNVSDKIYTTFIPLPSGSKFRSTVIFHNLKPEELGALLSALTFHGYQERECYHLLGQAKPFGYGRIKVIPTLEVYTPGYQYFDKETYMAKFEKMLVKKGMSVNVSQLITMACELRTGGQYEYMNLSMDKDGNEFQKAKDSGCYLEPYKKSGFTSWRDKRNEKISEIDTLSQEVKSKYEEKLKKAQEELQKQKELEEQKKQEQEMEKIRIQSIKAEADLLWVNQNFASALVKYQELYELIKEDETLLKIKECEEKLNSQIIPLSEYLKEVKVSSIPAFANGLEKKWMLPNGKTALDSNEIQTLINYLSGIYGQLSAKEQKKWNNSKDWKKLQTLAGDDIVRKVVK